VEKNSVKSRREEEGWEKSGISIREGREEGGT
jgi:hypothetical protein